MVGELCRALAIQMYDGRCPRWANHAGPWLYRCMMDDAQDGRTMQGRGSTDV